jgi:MoCo/4Fe-4S cofactor protein with predicted Tat translocation signal
MNYPLPNQSKKYFRSIAQLEGTPEFEQFLHREFPQAASEFPEGVSRRRWIQMMGASLALGGAAGCRYNREEFAEFVVRPEGRVAGVPQFFASNIEWAGRVAHVLVTTLEGRPTKLDANAEHPMYVSSASSEFNDGKDAKFNTGGTDPFVQAAVLSLYDPDRLGAVIRRVDGTTTFYEENELASWSEFDTFASSQAKELEGLKGKGLAVLFEPTKSPTLQRTLAAVRDKFPEAVFVEYESVYRRDQAKAVAAVGGGKASLLYDLSKAKVIVAFDDDLLGANPNATRYFRQFAMGRAPIDGKMNRLYAIESQYSVTGAASDFRFAMKSSQMEAVLDAIEAAIDAGKEFPAATDEKVYNNLSAQEKLERMIQVVATDLLANKGTSLLTVGAHQPISAQQTALRINQKLGNIGRSAVLLDLPSDIADLDTLRLDEFIDQANSGVIKTAWVLAPNPVFSVPGDVALGAAFEKIGNVVYAADTEDETSQYCEWTVPAAHPLEVWGDVRAADGVYGIGKKQINPLLGAKSLSEILATLAGFEVTDGEAMVRATAAKIVGGELSERKWKEILHAGFLADSAAKPASVEISTEKPKVKQIPGAPTGLEAIQLDVSSVDPKTIEIVVHPSDSVYDGRLANNGWLQELPQPISKLTWDNAAFMSIKTSRALGVKQGELIQLTQGDATVQLPVFLIPGHAEGSITVNLGYGRTRAGSVGGATRSSKDQFTVGKNLASLRRWNQHSILTGIEAKGTSIPYKLATTQDHFAIEDQGGMAEIALRSPQLIREGTLQEFTKSASFAQVHLHHKAESLWKEPDVAQNHAWAMTIDLNKCIGCNSCVIACQAENNVPIVGKEQVSRGREMHWLRIDRYFQSDLSATTEAGDYTDPVDPKIVSQPMACIHCDTAPCEQVCPVAATVHTEEGINAMAYNRCIGTRYCANNCPVKVRRFNYFNFNQKYGYFYGWQDKREEVNTKLQGLVLNPEVTVRGRGVMEKCTYCIQRVQNGKIKARQTGDGLVHDGDIRTACQEACPSQAIVFGNLNDKDSRVYRLQNDPRAYALLEELNIKPRTLYLARIRNVPDRLLTEDQVNPTWNPGHGSGHHDEHGDAHGEGHGHGDHDHAKESAEKH